MTFKLQVSQKIRTQPFVRADDALRHLLLKTIARESGRDIEIRRPDYATEDWLEAIQRLGGTVTTTFLPNPRPSIDAWMRNNVSGDLIVVASIKRWSGKPRFRDAGRQSRRHLQWREGHSVSRFVDRLGKLVVCHTHVVS